ncbi:hypothetical protein [Streptomyces sp. MK5]|uniref:hypothetical protein n=1 Tax=Streptomyces sp. MK5 TaxID=3064253 RepID=UPI00274285B0|nr:hypothetical protein [Streptomyces sp. MK5]
MYRSCEGGRSPRDLTALLLGTVVGERNQAQREIARACGQLAEMAAKIATGDHRPTFPDGEGEDGEGAKDAKEAHPGRAPGRA